MYIYNESTENLPLGIIQCSPQARELIREDLITNRTLDNRANEKWPINILDVGECFCLPRDWIKYSISEFRRDMILKAKRNNKGIAVINHKKAGIIEVARIY